MLAEAKMLPTRAWQGLDLFLFVLPTGLPVAKRITKLQQLQSAGPPAKTGRATVTLCEDFLNYLRGECHLAANTIAAYGRDMRRLVAWLGDQRLSSVTINQLSDYVGTLHEEGLAPASIARNVVATRTFFKYLQLEGVVKDNPAELIATQKMWQRIPGVLSIRQIDSFLSRRARPIVSGNVTWRCWKSCMPPDVAPRKSARYAFETSRSRSDMCAAKERGKAADGTDRSTGHPGNQSLLRRAPRQTGCQEPASSRGIVSIAKRTSPRSHSTLETRENVCEARGNRLQHQSS